MFNSIAMADVTPFVSLPTYNPPSYFVRLFRPFLDLGGALCPIGPDPRDNNPKTKTERRSYEQK
ncbi:MAG: hypothetical protein BWY53_00511 [Parcubacteria group bacterium ADurb.Bin326]|nr:MAG: hypothetical protein BWY53_00511 [Parcubacteria group bacterium ADurb.Bin326]